MRGSQWMGLKDTHLYKKIGKPATEPMPADQAKYGLGKSTPREMARVMERIGRCELENRGKWLAQGRSKRPIGNGCRTRTRRSAGWR